MKTTSASAVAAVAMQKAAAAAKTKISTSTGPAATTVPPTPPLPKSQEENSRQTIFDVIAALQQAIRRPLYVDLALQQQEQQQDLCKSPASKAEAAAAAAAVTEAAVTEDAAIGSKKKNSKTAAGQKQRVATTSAVGVGPTSVPPAPVSAPPKPPSLSWTELLARAARLLIHCTPKEHGEILRLAAIILLGHLLPLSTGNEHHLLQNAQRRNRHLNNFDENNDNANANNDNVVLMTDTQDQNTFGGSSSSHHVPYHQSPFLASSSSSSCSSFDMHNYILNMSMHERLTSAAQWHDAVQNATEMDYTIHPCPCQQVALTKFLQHAIRPLLLARPVHEYQVDLLHLLAMMIQPQPPSFHNDCDDENESDNDDKKEQDSHHPAWIHALALVKSRSALHFHVTYEHRVQAVQLVQLVVLPNGSSIDDDYDTKNMTYLQNGILRHLRTCLFSFAQHVALSTLDSHLANQTMVRLAAQQVPLQQQQKEWDYLLHQMVSDTIDYHAVAVVTTTLTTPAVAATTTTSSTVATDDDKILTIDYDYCPSKKKHNNECPHVLRGKVLAVFINQTFLRQSGSISGGIGSGLPALHWHILSSLADAIEWQMDAWIRGGGGGEKKKKQKRPPAVCLLASLVFAAKHAFPLASTMSNDDEDDDDDDEEEDNTNVNNHGDHGQVFETLLESAICLLRHSAFYIRDEATDLLIRAFSHRNDASSSSNPKKYARSLLEAMKFTLDNNSNNNVACATGTKGSANDKDENNNENKSNTMGETRHSLVPTGTERLVGIVSRASPAFAIHLTKFIMEKHHTGALAGRFLAAICVNCPTVARKQVDKFLDVLLDSKGEGGVVDREGTNSNDGSLSMIASILSARQARYFSNSRDSINDGMSAIHTALASSLTKNGNQWDYYRMACHAFRMGDFSFAATVFRKQLLSTSLNEKHYLWISVLEKVSTAEQILSRREAKGIPFASNMLHAAVSYLQSLRARGGQSEQILFTLPGANNLQKTTPKEGYEFQISFLLLRLDLLDLLTVLRQLTREMRLTGCSPAKYTRNFQHLKNTVHCFEALSARFAQLNQQYGIAFSSHYSTTCLVALQKVAMFLSQATRAVFADSLPTSSTKGSSPRGGGGGVASIPEKSIKINKTNLPVLQLIQELDELVVRPMMDASSSSSSSSSTAIDPLVRSAAMLELLDGLLMVPYPYPRDFYTPRPRLYSELHLSADAMEMMEYGSKTWNVIESYPSLCFTLQVAGRICPLLLRDKARCHRPIVMALLWLRIVYVGPLLQSDDDAGGSTTASGPAGGGGGGGGEGGVVDAVEQLAEDETTTAAAIAEVASSQQQEAIRQGLAKLPLASPLSMRLFPNNTGQFQAAVELPPLLEEGMYRIEVKLGCRDCVGAEWELPVTKNSHHYIPIRNSRSR